MCYSSIIVFCFVDVKWRAGIVEGYGQRVLTGVFGCEGEEVTTGWTELYNGELLYCLAGTEVDKRGRECSIHECRRMYGKRSLGQANEKARVVGEGDSGNVA
jgi:hypothetical protein